jgi:50S ribosomal protein L16 3-hydroxylase
MMAQRDNRSVDVNQGQSLLGGLSPAQFMRRHWHKKPLLVRQAVAGVRPTVTRARMFALAARDDVESRLIQRDADGRWQLRHGPLPRRGLPPLAQPGWTLLVQGLDLHAEAAHALISRFRFVPAARLDDVMLSYASDGGGVGPHVDSYDVFLLQVQGRRRWRIGPGPDRRPAALRDDVPLKMLARFAPAHDWLLDTGDMLYLPPDWAHDGVAVGGDCMTASIGFRAPRADELAQALLARLADMPDDARPAPRYGDPMQAATTTPAAVPEALQRFAHDAVHRALAEPGAVERTLGEWLTEPKAQVWFEAPGTAVQNEGRGVQLDRRSRMGYDTRFIFINGESLSASGRDARLMRRLADLRRLDALAVRAASPVARALLDEWLASGWLQPVD